MCSTCRSRGRGIVKLRQHHEHRQHSCVDTAIPSKEPLPQATGDDRLTFPMIWDEIAGCIEKAHERISLKEAARMLFSTTQKQMTQYRRECGWQLGANNYIVRGR